MAKESHIQRKTIMRVIEDITFYFTVKYCNMALKVIKDFISVKILYMFN